jgi:MFS transporter, DHA1 family, tetracycline resistance protein
MAASNDDDGTEAAAPTSQISLNEASVPSLCAPRADDDEGASLQSCLSFFRTFFQAKGTMALLSVSFLVSLGMGSVVGIVPGVMADRYARTRHHYSGDDCAIFDRDHKPDACQSGANDAQDAAAAATLVLNLLTLVFNPVVGSYSDRCGRRGVIVISLVLFSLGPMALVLLQLVPGLSPTLYYIVQSMGGAVDFFSMSFAAASDVLAPDIRAAGYGVLMACFYLGFSLAPQLPLIMSHFHVSLFSMASGILAVLVALVTLPETLPESVAEDNRVEIEQEQQQQNESHRQLRWSTSGSSYSDEETSVQFLLSRNDEQSVESSHWMYSVFHTATRPIRDMSILTRGNLPILAAASCFQAMVYATDKTFVIYYIEDQMNVRDDDIAKMFIIFCPLGVIIQAFFLQPLLRMVGEKRLLVIAFVSGTCHNLLYGLARSKNVILMALCLSQVTKMNFPLISSIASKSASVNEQGRVQGALFALNALANAVGPMLLEIVYDRSKSGHSFLGPGSMFLCASFLYAIGTVLVTFLPVTEADGATLPEAAGETLLGQDVCADGQPPESNASLREPLLDGSSDSF